MHAVSLKVRLKTGLVYRPFLHESLISVLLFITITVFSVLSTQTASAQTYPLMTFTNPVLISGVDKQAGAIYKFSNVMTGVDAWIEIEGFYGGAQLDDIDHFSAGYNEAWQPYVVAAINDTSYIDWKIYFKNAGTNTAYVFPIVAVTAVDVDGDGSYLKELIQAETAGNYLTAPSCNLAINTLGNLNRAISPVANVANIDTVMQQAMFQMNFSNKSVLDYRTGAVSTYSAEEIRQTCLFFKSFFSSPLLPITLVSFTGSLVNENSAQLNWVTASELNNDYFTVERSADAIDFTSLAVVQGAGNSNQTINYSTLDKSPLSGLSYYRLKQTDFNGQFSYSNIVHIEAAQSNFEIVNTFSSIDQKVLEVTLNCSRECMISFELYDLTGRKVYSFSENVLGNQKVSLSTASLSPNIYMLKACNGNKIISKKIKV